MSEMNVESATNNKKKSNKKKVLKRQGTNESITQRRSSIGSTTGSMNKFGDIYHEDNSNTPVSNYTPLTPGLRQAKTSASHTLIDSRYRNNNNNNTNSSHNNKNNNKKDNNIHNITTHAQNNYFDNNDSKPRKVNSQGSKYDEKNNMYVTNQNMADYYYPAMLDNHYAVCVNMSYV